MTKYSDIANFKFGGVPGMDYESYLILNRIIVFIAIISTGWFASKVFKLSKVSYSALWLIYNVNLCGIFVCGYISGDSSGYTFQSLTFLHVYSEFLLVVRTVEGKRENQDWWGSNGTIFICTAYFFGMLLWQPMNYFAFGSLCTLPIDLMTFPAAISIMNRARDNNVWWLGFVWATHVPFAYAIMGCLVWGMNADENYAGLPILGLFIGMIAQIFLLVPIFDRLDPNSIGETKKEDEGVIELGLAAPPDDKPSPKAPGMPWIFRMVSWLLIFFVGPTTLLPFALGYSRFDQLMFNACETYWFGEVQTLKNVGPHFLIPGMKCNIDFDN